MGWDLFETIINWLNHYTDFVWAVPLILVFSVVVLFGAILIAKSYWRRSK